RMKMPDGSYRWMLTRAVPSSDDPESARWFGTITDIDDRYRISQERELLAGELAHRIKNVFSVITGLISLRSRGDDGNENFGKTLNDNIRALSRAQEFALPGDNQHGETLADLLGVLMAPYGADGSQAVSISGDTASFSPRAATPLALIFHELATNSIKYGALSARDGRVAIEVETDSDTVTIHWRESGGPAVTEPQETGFGTRLISMAIDHQLGGTMAQEWHESGLEIKIAIPRERLSQ
ncbi:MAG: HWE histidine kinase domain-containing protein, partial [Pseudomonadota bacterium]